MSSMSWFLCAAGGGAVIYWLMTRVGNRSADRGSGFNGPSADNNFGGPSSSNGWTFSNWFGGDNSSSHSSGSSSDFGSSAGGGDSGGGGGD